LTFLETEHISTNIVFGVDNYAITFFDILDFRVSFVAQVMKTSDKIIIEELKRIILMQAQEIAKIPLLVARIEVLERELARYTTRKDSNNSSLPPSKDENRPPRTNSLREKGNRKAGGQPEMKGKP
jgi:hypothetical protein